MNRYLFARTLFAFVVLALVFPVCVSAQMPTIGMQWKDALALFNKATPRGSGVGYDASFKNATWEGRTGVVWLRQDDSNRLVEYTFFADSSTSKLKCEIAALRLIPKLGTDYQQIHSGDSDERYNWYHGPTRYSLSTNSGDFIFEARSQQDWLDEELYGPRSRASSDSVIVDSVVTNGKIGYRTRLVHWTTPHPAAPRISPVLRLGMPWDSVVLLLSTAEPYPPKIDTLWTAVYDKAHWNGFIGQYYLMKDSAAKLCGYEFHCNGQFPDSLWNALVVMQSKV